jgi:hypothetical protein
VVRKDAVPRELRRAACDTMLARRCQAIDNNRGIVRVPTVGVMLSGI